METTTSGDANLITHFNQKYVICFYFLSPMPELASSVSVVAIMCTSAFTIDQGYTQTITTLAESMMELKY